MMEVLRHSHQGMRFFHQGSIDTVKVGANLEGYLVVVWSSNMVVLSSYGGCSVSMLSLGFPAVGCLFGSIFPAAGCSDFPLVVSYVVCFNFTLNGLS
ncbi:hypothetical protein M5K25_028076 [Dendrobium thyrsiflorum]|uniref:Uncharacterized protein n=1 Tax=Dendrobium thyrsiflorum TaxID=117978 RepID=A0ABD0TVP0_DENTH